MSLDEYMYRAYGMVDPEPVVPPNANATALKAMLDECVRGLFRQADSEHRILVGDFATDLLAEHLDARGVVIASVRNCERCLGLIPERQFAAKLDGKLYHLRCANQITGRA